MVQKELTQEVIRYVRPFSSCKKNCLQNQAFSGFGVQTLSVTVLGWIINTVEALVSGHPLDAKKVSLSGSVRLREGINTEFE